MGSMLALRQIVTIITAICVTPLAAQADRRPKKQTIRGAKLIKSFEPSRGFIDNPFTFDSAGGRLLYVSADAATRATVTVVDVNQHTRLLSVDISAFTTKPESVSFVLDGEHFLAVERHEDTGKAKAALIDKKGKIIRRFGPADDIVATEYDGKDAVVTYTVKRTKKKKGAPKLQHHVHVVDLATGKTIGKKTTIETDLDGVSNKLDFSIKYWTDDYTRAVGVKGGSWDRKENQRAPDYEAWYEVPTRTFSKRVAIKNVMEHTRMLRKLGEHTNEKQFITVATDLSGVVLNDRSGMKKAIKIALPFHHYNHKSLEYRETADGSMFFVLRVDPVHPDAVARKKAVTDWIDLYELRPGSAKAKRRARLFLPKKRGIHWRATSEFWAVTPRHVGFSRGGKRLELYKLNK